MGTFRLQASSHLKRQNDYASVSSGMEKRAVRVEGRGAGGRVSGEKEDSGRGVKAALTAQHVVVGVIRHRVYVGRGLRAALSLVSGYHGGCTPLYQATCQLTSSGIWSCVCQEGYEGDGLLCYGNAAVVSPLRATSGQNHKDKNLPV